MADEIVLSPRYINGELVEGEIHLQMNPEITKDIEIIIPNKDSRYVTKETLESGNLNLSILGGCVILKPEDQENFSDGTFKVSNYEKYPTYDGVPENYILEFSDTPDFTEIKKSYSRSDFNKDFILNFEKGGETLYARVKTETDLHISNASPVVKFKTLDNYSHKPTILTPVNGTTNMAWTIYGTVSDYMYINSENYCDGLRVSYSENETFPDELTKEFTLYRDENENEIVDFTDYIKDFTIKGLKENKTYYIRVAYIGKIYGASEWSNVVEIKTYNMPDSIIEATNKNIYPEVLLNNKETEDNKERHIFSSKGKSILVSTVNEKFQHKSTKSINMTETNLLDINISKVLQNETHYFILGLFTYGGETYKGSLKKHFITKVTKDYKTPVTRTFEVLEDIEYDVDGNMIPYSSNVTLKDAQIVNDEIYVFGTIPHPTVKSNIITSYYKVNSELNITEYKNFTYSNRFIIEKFIIKGINVYSVGTTNVDIGGGTRPKIILVKFDIENGNLQLLNNKIIGREGKHDFGNSLLVYGEDDDIVVSGVSNSDGNIMGEVLLLNFDTFFTLKNSGKITTIYRAIVKEITITNGNKFRMIGNTEADRSLIMDANMSENLSFTLNKVKALDGHGTLVNSKNTYNNIVCFGSDRKILCLNDDIDVVGSGIAEVTAGYIEEPVLQSSIVIENITNEFIANSITCSIVATSNVLTNTIIS